MIAFWSHAANLLRVSFTSHLCLVHCRHFYYSENDKNHSFSSTILFQFNLPFLQVSFLTVVNVSTGEGTCCPPVTCWTRWGDDRENYPSYMHWSHRTRLPCTGNRRRARCWRDSTRELKFVALCRQCFNVCSLMFLLTSCCLAVAVSDLIVLRTQSSYSVNRTRSNLHITFDIFCSLLCTIFC